MNSMIKFVCLILLAGFVLSACASKTQNERRQERERVANSSRMMCDFINAEKFPDADIELNIQMGRRCDPDKNFSITQFRTPSDNQGIMYCCVMNPRIRLGSPSRATAPNSSEDSESGSVSDEPETEN